MRLLRAVLSLGMAMCVSTGLADPPSTAGPYKILKTAKVGATGGYHVLFVACRNPQTMVMINANDGTIIAALPIGMGTDGAVFNPSTMEAFSSQTDGTLTIIKENSPTSFAVAQSVQTMPSAKTLTLDSKTNQILVIGAQFEPPPTPPAGERPRRGPMVTDSFSILVVGK